MRKTMQKAGALLLAVSMLFSLAACGGSSDKNPTVNTDPGKKEPDVPALVQALLQKVSFASPLSDVGESAFLYFSNLPEGTQVQLYAGSGYFADEVVLLTLAKESDKAAVKASVDQHIAQIRSQFANYIPEELAKIDKALVWEYGKYIVVCISDDYANAKKLLDSGDPAYPLTPTVPTAGTTPTTVPTEPVVTTPTTVPTDPVGSEPTVTPTEPEHTEPTTPTEPTVPTTEPTAPTTPEHTDPTEPVDWGVDENGYPILMSQSGAWHYYANGVMRVDNAGYEPCGYDATVAGSYASLVNKVADQLAGTTKVYCLPIPTGFDIMLPNDLQAKHPFYISPIESIQRLDNMLGENVTTIHCADNLMLHRDEYIYFRTDHHWNGIGAYYAYEAFCETKGITPYTMEQRREMVFDGFLGSYYTHNPDQAFLPADTVYAYKPFCTQASMVYYDRYGTAYAWPIICDVSGYDASTKYYTFAASDQPLAKFTNPQVKDGSVAIVVKESFGNALMPYLVDHYSTIYEVDYRYWSGDLVSFAREVGATEMIFANNTGMINTNISVARLSNIIK